MTRACCVLLADCRGRRNLPVHNDADPARLGRPERVLQLPVEVGVSQHQHHTKRLHSRRCGCHPLPKRLHSIRNRARSSSAPPLLGPEFRYCFRFRAPSRAPSWVWLEPELPGAECGAPLAGVIPDGRGPSHIGPKWRAIFFLRFTPPAASIAKTVFAMVSCSLSRLLFCCGDVTY
jgi:hypothetical protein